MKFDKFDTGPFWLGYFKKRRRVRISSRIKCEYNLGDKQSY